MAWHTPRLDAPDLPLRADRAMPGSACPVSAQRSGRYIRRRRRLSRTAALSSTEEDRAAFKIWGDSKNAPADAPLNADAQALADVISAQNNFDAVKDTPNLIMAQFYAAPVAFK